VGEGADHFLNSDDKKSEILQSFESHALNMLQDRSVHGGGKELQAKMESQVSLE
jgi:hypothetical protein